MNRNRRDNDTVKNVILAIIFLMIVFMTAGYAAYTKDLIINSAGKIYSDWDVRFTKVDLNHLDSTLSDDEKGGSIVPHAPVLAEDGLSISLDVGLSYTTDEVIYDIEITNYSEMFDAEYKGATFSTSNADWILYEINDINIGDKIAVDTSGGNAPNTRTVQLRAYWNPAKTARPDGSTMEYETTYTENATITLVFESATP